MKRWVFVVVLLLTGLTAPAALADTTAQTPDGSTWTYALKADGTCSITRWSGTAEQAQLAIPESLDGHAVTEIRCRSFFRAKNVKALSVPDSVTTILSTAFASMPALERVELGAGLTEVPAEAFFGCKALKQVVFKGAIACIGSGTFKGCTALSDIQLPEGLTRIGQNAFYDCSMLTQIQLPQSLIELGWGAFINTGLTEIALPDGLQTVGFNPFAGTPLKALQLSPDHAYLECADGVLYSRADHRLVGCVLRDQLPEHYTVKAGTETIEECGFALCRNLKSLDIPDSVTSIGAFAFHSCTSLTELRLPAGLKGTGSWTFYACDALKTLEFPEGMEDLPDSAIYDCAALERVVIPASVTSISNTFMKDCPHATIVVERNSPVERNVRAAYPGRVIYPDGTVPSAIGDAAHVVTHASPETYLRMLSIAALIVAAAVLWVLSTWHRKPGK